MTIIEELREIAQRKCNCHEVVRMFGFACGESPCTECIPRLIGAISDRIDAERALPEGIEWPRFEDGGLVGIGDELSVGGEAWRACSVILREENWVLRVERDCDTAAVRGDYGERVKRPKPQVLDADGAPIEVGDTVWCDDGDEPLRVTLIHTSGYRSVSLDGKGGEHYSLDPERLTHERPDSWEQLEKDAYHLVMSEYLETPEKDVSDIVRRAKALAKAGEGE